MKRLSSCYFLLLLFSTSLFGQLANFDPGFKVVGKVDSPQRKIMEFQYKTAQDIYSCLKGKDTKDERSNVLQYKHGKKTFDPEKCKFLGDCSWWSTAVLKNVYPKLYAKMLPLSEEGNPDLRAYVYFNIFYKILKLQKKSFNVEFPNAWVLNTTPEEMKQTMIKNNLNDKKVEERVNSYKIRYDFLKHQMNSDVWKKALNYIKDAWIIIDKIQDINAGDFFVVNYNWSKSAMQKGSDKSTGHIMMVVKKAKQVKTNVLNPLNLVYKTYKLRIMDSAPASKKLNDPIRKTSDAGIGVRDIYIRVNRVTGKYAGWKTYWDDKEKKLDSFNWYKDGWHTSKSEALAGRINPDYKE